MRRDPQKLVEWQQRSRHQIKARPKNKPRRVAHPFPLPEPGQVITLADVAHELHAFGPQAELCRRTECAACFAVRMWAAGYRRDQALPWAMLRTADERVSDPHHEPHRGLRGKSLDRDTMPLCRRHHTDGVGHCVRHRIRSDKLDAASFYKLLPFDWRAVVAEMRRRVAAAQGTTP